MIKKLTVAALLAICAGAACASPIIFYSANPTSNNANWTNYMNSLHGTVDTNVNFNAHPTGNLIGGFYAGTDNVTLATTGSWTVANGAGPGDGNAFNSVNGEATHAASNYLYGNAGAKTLTLSFQGTTVLGVSIGVIDKFGYGSQSDPMTLTAYAGVNGTGANLGSTTIYDVQNFQNNKEIFMGVADSSNQIRSIIFSYNGNTTGDRIGVDDISIARAPANNVPEPASIALTAAGLLALALRRRAA